MGNICGKTEDEVAKSKLPPSSTFGSVGNQDDIVSPLPVPPAKKKRREAAAALVAARKEIETNDGKFFYDYYETDTLIGRGAFARVFAGTKKGEKSPLYAIKVVCKDEDDPEKQKEAMVKKIAIMRMLQSHPNMVTLHEVYSDEEGYHVVLENCEGGALFDEIVRRDHFTEKQAAEVMHQLLDFISFCHSKDIMHRDLKPENLLLEDRDEEHPRIKVIDFGTAEFCKPGQKLTARFGTPHYVAPEVLLRNYDKSADIWSAGVILYILLSGYPPFKGRSDTVTLENVKLGQYDLSRECWKDISDSAKDLISKMLVKDITKRATADELLEHPWFQEVEHATHSLNPETLKRLRTFSCMSKMKQLALKLLARNVTDEDLQKLRDEFEAEDKDDDGRIDHMALHRALDRVGLGLSEQYVSDLLAVCNVTEGMDIDYEELIVAMFDAEQRIISQGSVMTHLFDEMDHDHDGYITAEDLLWAMQGNHHGNVRASLDLAREMLGEVGHEKDGRVTREQFNAIMRRQFNMPEADEEEPGSKDPGPGPLAEKQEPVQKLGTGVHDSAQSRDGPRPAEPSGKLVTQRSSPVSTLAEISPCEEASP